MTEKARRERIRDTVKERKKNGQSVKEREGERERDS